MQPTHEEWRHLYQVTQKVKDLAPWEWMEESDVFGVKNPETSELGFVSVMGMAGEYFAVALYQGAKAFHDLVDFAENPVGDPMTVLQIPQLQAVFGDRDDLEKEDRALLKQLGLKFRGQNAWLMFRSYRPGMMPWFLEADEVRFLTYALEQLLEVAPRFDEDPDLLEQEEEDHYLIRVQKADKLWADEVTPVPHPPAAPLKPVFDIEAITALQALQKRSMTLEIDFFLFPSPIKEKTDPRPYFPFVLLMVDGRDGFILANDLLKPLPSLQALHAALPGRLLAEIQKLGVVPSEIHVHSELLLDILRPLTSSLGFKLKQARSMSVLDAVRDMLLNVMG